MTAEHAVDHDEVIAAARSGDRVAFGLLYIRYRQMVHAVVLSIPSVGDADDVVQEVFLTAMRRLHTLRDPGSFGAWLAAIARNEARGSLGRTKSSVELTDQRIGSRQEDDAAAQLALSTIRSLPEAYRETLLMRLVEGMTGPEIAAQTGLTPDSVRVNLHRGMRLLREALGGTTR